MRRILNRLHAATIPKPLKHWGQGVYEKLPYILKYGRLYYETLHFLEESQFWTREQHERYQVQQLQKLIQHAINNVPFYRKRYKEAGIEAGDIQAIEHVQELPFISKDDLINHIVDIKSENFAESKFQYHTTGGSTGKPVGLYWEADRTVPIEKAFLQRQFSWIGHNPEKDRIVTLKGIPPSKGRSYEFVTKHQLRLSSYQLTSTVLDEYIDIINNFQPVALQAYPSSALLLANHIINNNTRTLPSIRAVLCGSEQLYEWQRAILAKAFRCKIYSWYGQSEYVSLAGECEYSSEYHFYSEYGLTEIIKSDRTPAQAGESGEIIATGFSNFAFPLIRYRTGDIATLSTKENCECGRSYTRASRIEGRIQEMIISKNGNQIAMTAINMHDDVFDNIYQFQFYQDTPGELTMNIIPKPSYTREDERKIREALYEKIGDQCTIYIREVNAVEQTLRGKTSFLVQRIPVEHFARIIRPQEEQE